MSATEFKLDGFDLFRLGAQGSPQAAAPATPSATRGATAAAEDRSAALSLNRLLYLALIENCVCTG